MSFQQRVVFSTISCPLVTDVDLRRDINRQTSKRTTIGVGHCSFVCCFIACLTVGHVLVILSVRVADKHVVEVYNSLKQKKTSLTIIHGHSTFG